MQAHKVRVEVPEDHRITVDLPEGFPAGPAEVIVLAAGGEGRRIVRAGGSLSGVEPVTEGEDPIADALDELRHERAAGLEPTSDLVEQAE
jgi:hypothetical protein